MRADASPILNYRSVVVEVVTIFNQIQMTDKLDDVTLTDVSMEILTLFCELICAAC